MDPSPDPADHATRQISAAFFYDQDLSHRLLDELGDNPHAYIAGHDGLNGATITGHAARSLGMWRRHNLVVLVVALLPTVWAVQATDSLWTLVPGLLLLAANLWLLGRLSSLLGRRRSITVWALIGFTLLVVMSRLSGALPAIRPFQELSDLPTFLLFFPTLPAIVADLGQRIWTQARTMRRFRPGAWDPTPPPVSDSTISAAMAALSQTDPAGPSSLDGQAGPGPNATVYSGFVPFVGAGFERGRWNRTLELRPRNPAGEAGSPGPASSPIDERELYATVLQHLRSLGLPQTLIRRWHFVEGTRASQVPGLVRAPLTRPAGWIDPRLVVEGAVSDELIRPYLWISSNRWSGDLILNSFVRVSPQGWVLFVEVAHHVVAPLPGRYDRCDRDLDLHLASTWRTLIGEATQGTTDLVGNLAWDLTRGLRWRRAHRQANRRHNEGLAIDYGASASIRDLFAGPGDDQYFQARDADRFAQTIDLQVLHALQRAVSARGVGIARFEWVVESLAGEPRPGGDQGSAAPGRPAGRGVDPDRDRAGGQDPIAGRGRHGEVE